MAQLLVRWQRGEVNVRDSDGATPLFPAAQNGHKEIVWLLLENGADFRAKKDQYGKTALDMAAEAEHIAVVQQLLENGADVNARIHNGETLLGWAIKGPYETIVADVNTRMRHGETPLQGAAKEHYETMVKLLLKNGTDINARIAGGYTALHWAAMEHRWTSAAAAEKWSRC